MLASWLLPFFLLLGADDRASIKLVKTDEARVDVFVVSDGKTQPFTSYYYGIGFHKPIFHPLRDSKGNIITRRYPIELGVPGEPNDHWHHEGMWLTYGLVNGIDFWAKVGEARKVSGKIRHTGFEKIESGKTGRLIATADWIPPDGKTVLKEKSTFAFTADADSRVVDATYVLTAQDQKVTFEDTKEGMFGIRVTPSLHEDQTGSYVNAQGQEKEAGVWGKRSEWVALRGKVNNQEVTLVIFNHPESTSFPTFWHARAYGLFAANPFGRKDFEKGAAPLNFTLQPGQSATFRYRILIQSSRLSPEELKSEYQRFAGK